MSAELAVINQVKNELPYTESVFFSSEMADGTTTLPYYPNGYAQSRDTFNGHLGPGTTNLPGSAYQRIAGSESPIPVGTAISHNSNNTICVGDKMYLITIGTSSTDTEVFEYDITLNVWTQRTTLAGVRMAYFRPFVIGSVIYIIYYYDYTATAGHRDQIRTYDTSTHTWGTITPPATRPTATSDHNIAFDGTDTAYFYGGTAGSDAYWTYTVSTNTFTQISANTGTTAHSNAGMFYNSADDCLYIVGGHIAGTSNRNLIQVLNASDGSYNRRIYTLNAMADDGCGAVRIGDRIYFYTGYTTNGCGVYDLTTGVLQFGQGLAYNTPFSTHALATDGTNIYWCHPYYSIGYDGGTSDTYKDTGVWKWDLSKKNYVNRRV